MVGDVEIPSREADAPHRGAETTGIDWLSLLLIAIPAVLILAAGWAHRWTADDGFINVRVVQQIFDGNGPVFNAGERVEAATSTLWIALLVVGHAVFFWVPIEWIAVFTGLLTTAAAVVIAQLAAARSFGTRKVIPFAIIAFIALPPVWDFATSGLETGLSLVWIAGSYYALVSRSDDRRGLSAPVAAMIMGLGPLVRPDLIVVSIIFLGCLVAVEWPAAPRDLVRLAVAAIALPALYELFRIGYYGALLPNTAFAKEALRSYWSHGTLYLRDFADPYRLWLVVALVGVVIAVAAWSRDRRSRLVMLAPVLVGVVYGFLVVRGGGDFMHARMLLPALFAILLPVAALPRQQLSLAPLALLLLWTVVPLWSGGPPYESQTDQGITNERHFWTGSASRHPVTMEDYRQFLETPMWDAASEARDLAESDAGAFVAPTLSGNLILPLQDDVPHGAVLRAGAIGLPSVAAGTDVYVADEFSLVDPIGARAEIGQRDGAPGHEKHLLAAWHIARFVDPAADVPAWFAPPRQVDAAREALECPFIEGVLERSSNPLTLGQIGSNYLGAFEYHTKRISPNPIEAARDCD